MEISEIVISSGEAAVIDLGAWVGDIAGFPGVRVLVTGLTRNPDAQAAIRQRLEAIQKASDEQAEPDEKQRAQVIKTVLADIVLQDWDGFTQGGKKLKFSREKAKQWIESREGEMLAALVFAAASKIDENASAFVDSVAKN